MKNLRILTSKLPLTEVQLAWLSTEGWTTEQLLFVATHGEKIGVNITDLGGKHDYVAKCMKVQSRLDSQARGNIREYDSKNKLEGANTPSWFRKSFDRNLFK